MGKFIVKVRANGDYQFNLLATNGQVILTSQGYKAKTSCLNGIESVKRNSQDETKFVVSEAKNGKPYLTSWPPTARSSAPARCMPTSATSRQASLQ